MSQYFQVTISVSTEPLYNCKLIIATYAQSLEFTMLKFSIWILKLIHVVIVLKGQSQDGSTYKKLLYGVYMFFTKYNAFIKRWKLHYIL